MSMYAPSGSSESGREGAEDVVVVDDWTLSETDPEADVALRLGPGRTLRKTNGRDAAEDDDEGGR